MLSGDAADAGVLTGLLGSLNCPWTNLLTQSFSLLAAVGALRRSLTR